MRPTKEELDNLHELYMEIAEENWVVFRKRHFIYGADNINEKGKKGIVEAIRENCVKLLNTMERNEVYDTELDAMLDKHEKDAACDTSNYAIIYEMKRRGEWPK